MEPGPIRKILTHLVESLKPLPVSSARGPPTNFDQLVQVHDQDGLFLPWPDNLPPIEIPSR
jgi:hypothetical protein